MISKYCKAMIILLLDWKMQSLINIYFPNSTLVKSCVTLSEGKYLFSPSYPGWSLNSGSDKSLKIQQELASCVHLNNVKLNSNRLDQSTNLYVSWILYIGPLPSQWKTSNISDSYQNDCETWWSKRTGLR